MDKWTIVPAIIMQILKIWIISFNASKVHSETRFNPCAILSRIGGKNKTTKQIKDVDKSYVVADGILVGSKKIIPLYLFGMLY